MREHRYRITLELEVPAPVAEAYFQRVSAELHADVAAAASTLFQMLDENGEPIIDPADLVDA